MREKGSVHLWTILLVVIFLVAVGTYLYNRNKSSDLSLKLTSSSAALTTQDPKYSNEFLSFSLPNDYEVIEETEEEYSERTNTKYRKNFAYYVEYQPPVFIKGLVVKNKKQKLNSQFNNEPLIVWVLENKDQLDPEGWYKDYWYYPFVWGEFSAPEKDKSSPKNEATISGQVAGFNTVSYQPGKPKFILISSQDKMFLLRIIEDPEKTAENILSNLKIK